MKFSYHNVLEGFIPSDHDYGDPLSYSDSMSDIEDFIDELFYVENEILMSDIVVDKHIIPTNSRLEGRDPYIWVDDLMYMYEREHATISETFREELHEFANSSTSAYPFPDDNNDLLHQCCDILGLNPEDGSSAFGIKQHLERYSKWCEEIEFTLGDDMPDNLDEAFEEFCYYMQDMQEIVIPEKEIQDSMDIDPVLEVLDV